MKIYAERIGFIGLGKLGMPCAEAIAQKGFEVVGYDIEKKQSHHIEIRDSIEDVCRDTDIVFVATPTPHEEGYDGRKPTSHKEPKDFATYWFHNGFVNVEGEKMSKSIGNIRLVHELNKKYKGEVLRLTLLSAHYKQPLNWTEEIIEQNSKMLDRLYRVLLELSDTSVKLELPTDSIMESFLDDLNTPKIIAKLNEEANSASSASKDRRAEIKKNLLSAGKILGILENNPENWLGYNQKSKENSEEIERLINERNEARRSKNFNLADTIREALREKGIEIEDTDKGTIWRKSR